MRKNVLIALLAAAAHFAAAFSANAALAADAEDADAAGEIPAVDADGFIGRWLIGGPFPSYEVEGRDQGSGLDTDFLDGEATASLHPGRQDPVDFLADDSKLIVALDLTNEWGVRHSQRIVADWREMKFENPSRISMNKLFGPINDHFVYYAACWVESPADRDVKILLGSDDDHKLYVNGQLVGRSATSQDARPRFNYTARLRRGLNPVLLKVADRLYDTGFCLALLAPDGKPLEGLKIHSDSPARRLGANSYDAGFAVNFHLPEKPVYDDQAAYALRADFHAPDARTYRLSLDGNETTLKSGESWTVDIPLAAGPRRLDLAVRAPDGNEAARLVQEFPVHSRDGLSRRRAALEKEHGEHLRRHSALEKEIAENRARLERAKQDLEKARGEAEENYAAQRRAAEAAADARASVDEPFEPAPGLRETLLLNGAWRAGASPEKLDAVLRLPREMYGSYFRYWEFPDDIDNHPKIRFNIEKMAPLPGYTDEGYHPLICTKDRAVFERDFRLDAPGDPDKDDWFFVCDNISGMVEVSLNGVVAGDWRGTVGRVEIRLPAPAAGKNTLRVDYRVDPLHGNKESQSRGLMGDLTLERRPRRHVADVWVKPSWRKAALARVVEIANPDPAPAAFRLEQFAVRDGRVALRAAAREGVLEAGKTATLRLEDKWRDPVFYTLENPALYELVSDLYIDGVRVDRHVQSFGFREFWMHGVDFFYNGKRIILQGDLGVRTFAVEKSRDVIFPLLRADNINILRLHDAQCHHLPAVAEAADRHGVFLIAQTYPIGDFERKRDSSLVKDIGSAEKFFATDWHRQNLENYRRWHRVMRNHPSILIWSIDNELMTPGCYSRGLEERNRIVDDIVDSYYRHVKSLDPDLVVTRDGDSCTYDSGHYRHIPDSPANVHYPEFKKDIYVHDWQRLFEYRPALYGETLYCSYVWGGWPGATSANVSRKAKQVRETVALYRELGIPAAIYMGLSLDGYVELKADGTGSTWRVGEVPRANIAERPENWRHGVPENEYPYIRIDWPAASGRGPRPLYQRNAINGFGYLGINWSSPKYEVCVRNAVNDAYRDGLIPQPPLADPAVAEVVLRAEPDEFVFTTLPDGRRYAVLADDQGRAWFHLNGYGVREFESAGVKREIDLTAPRAYATRPGFDQVPVIDLRQ